MLKLALAAAFITFASACLAAPMRSPDDCRMPDEVTIVMRNAFGHDVKVVTLEGDPLKEFHAAYTAKYRGTPPDSDKLMIFQPYKETWLLASFKDGCTVGNIQPVKAVEIIELLEGRAS